MIEEGEDLPTRQWMPSRIPVRDALAAKFAAGVHVPDDRIPKAYEARWYRTLVIAKTTLSRSALWHLRRLFGAHSAA